MCVAADGQGVLPLLAARVADERVTGPVAAAELMTAEPSGDVAAAPRSPVLASTTSAGTAIRA